MSRPVREPESNFSYTMRCCWIEPSSVDACARMIFRAVLKRLSSRSAAFHTRFERSDVAGDAPTTFEANPANASGFANTVVTWGRGTSG